MKRTETCFTDRSEDEAYLAFVLNELKERYGQKKGGIFLGESKKGNEGKAFRLFLKRLRHKDLHY